MMFGLQKSLSTYQFLSSEGHFTMNTLHISEQVRILSCGGSFYEHVRYCQSSFEYIRTFTFSYLLYGSPTYIVVLESRIPGKTISCEVIVAVG